MRPQQFAAEHRGQLSAAQIHNGEVSILTHSEEWVQLSHYKVMIYRTFWEYLRELAPAMTENA